MLCYKKPLSLSGRPCYTLAVRLLGAKGILTMPRGSITFLCGLVSLSFLFVIQAQSSLAAPAIAQGSAPEATSSISVVKTAPAKHKIKKAGLDKAVSLKAKADKGKPEKGKPDDQLAENYRVKEGDHLWQILRRESGATSERELRRLYAKTLRLNPGLNPERLVPGQRLRLARAQGASGVAGGQLAGNGRAGGQAAGVAGGRQAGGEVSASQAVRAGDALSALYAELGEETVSRGKHFIPLPEAGQMVLDASKFPLLQVGGNTRFVLDLSGRIPTEVDGLLAEASGYKILRYETQRGLRGLLDDALLGSGLGAQRAGALKLSGPLPAEVHSDWLLPRGKDSEVIFLIGKPSEATSTAVARHLARRGVHVIDVMAPEGGQVRVSRRETGALPDYTPPETAQGTDQVISRVLAMLGVGFTRNATVSLFGSDSSPSDSFSGFSLRHCADFGFERGGKKYLIDTAKLSPRWREVLERRGYQVLVIPDDAKGREAALTLLRFLGEQYREGYTLLGGARAEANNIRLNVPGLVVDTGKSKYLLSDAEADEGLAAALSQAGLKVIQLK
jgi:hypothetical protein